MIALERYCFSLSFVAPPARSWFLKFPLRTSGIRIWLNLTSLLYFQYAQVEFKEGVLQPPQINSSVELPENVDLFGQKINLSPIQQSLGPLQEAAANIGRTISGQPPLKVPIPGNRASTWLLITYLDEDLQISRGDGGLFVLAKEGSPLLEL